MKTVKDIKGVVIKEDDWCYFWNDINKKVKYQFYGWYGKKVPLNYISIDKADDDDLSWWAYCEKIRT